MKKKLSKTIFFTFLIMSLFLFSKTNDNMFMQSNQDSANHKLPSLQADPLIVIDEDSDFLAFPGYGNESHPYIIEGFDIETTTSNDIGILIANTSKHFEIRNNDINSVGVEGRIGIAVSNVTQNTAKIINNFIRLYSVNIYAIDAEGIIIEDNDCAKAGHPGIRLDTCPHARIENNDVYNMVHPVMKESKSTIYTINADDHWDREARYCGIFLQYCSDSNISANSVKLTNIIAGIGIAVQDSNRILIDNNLVSDVEIGVVEYEYLEKAGIYLKVVINATIFKNTVQQTDKCSINTVNCDKLLIANNTLDESETIGISMVTTSNSNITNNIIQNNPSFGVDISADSSNNIIHHNHFIDNNAGSAQARDSGTNNVWYDATINEGNWWNDWTGGDYSIDGAASSVDPYPLGDPVPFPEFSTSKLLFITAIPILCLVVVILRKRK